MAGPAPRLRRRCGAEAGGSRRDPGRPVKGLDGRQRPGNEMSNFGRNLALWVIIALLLVVLFNLFQPGTGRSADQQIAYSDFIGEVNAGRVRDVTVQGHTLSGHLSDNRTFQTYMMEDPQLSQRLLDRNVHVNARPEESDVPP